MDGSGALFDARRAMGSEHEPEVEALRAEVERLRGKLQAAKAEIERLDQRVRELEAARNTRPPAWAEALADTLTRRAARQRRPITI